MSYLRASLFSSEPSPNQPAAPMPVNVTLLPAAETELILTRPSMTPVQASTVSPLRITTVPPGKRRSSTSAIDTLALAKVEPGPPCAGGQHVDQLERLRIEFRHRALGERA